MLFKSIVLFLLCVRSSFTEGTLIFLPDDDSHTPYGFSVFNNLGLMSYLTEGTLVKRHRLNLPDSLQLRDVGSNLNS